MLLLLEIKIVDRESLIVLLVIPQNQFCDKQLFDLKTIFGSIPIEMIVLSKSGSEAIGEKKTKLIPDGILVDWNKRFLPNGKFDAVVVVGGKGAKNSIWNDPILPQILTDHYRAGKIVGALGISVVSLARAGLLTGQCTSAPDHEGCIRELIDAGALIVEEPLTYSNQIITAAGDSSGKSFGIKTLELLGLI